MFQALHIISQSQSRIQQWSRSHRLLTVLAVALAVAVICAVAYIAVPGESRWLPQCQFHRLTGLYCPGCGNTRALHALVHGDIVKSLRCNVLLVPMSILAGLIAGSRDTRMRMWLSYAAGGSVVLFGILRNLPWQPFTLLSPP